MASKQTCGNCKFSSGWKMTKHNPPRINQRYLGKCEYPIVLPALPICLSEIYKRPIRPFRVWDDECLCWQPKGAGNA